MLLATAWAAARSNPPSTASLRNRTRSGSVSKRVGPVDRRPQRLLPPHRGARPARQEAESVVQAAEDVVQRECAHAGRSQFDGKRHSVQAPADLLDGGRIVLADSEIGPDPARSVGEQVDRLVTDRQRRHQERHLARHPERFPAGRKQS